MGMGASGWGGDEEIESIYIYTEKDGGGGGYGREKNLRDFYWPRKCLPGERQRRSDCRFVSD